MYDLVRYHAYNGNFVNVKFYYEYYDIDIHFDDDFILYWAIHNEYLDIFIWLMELNENNIIFSVLWTDIVIIFQAVKNDNQIILEMILQYIKKYNKLKYINFNFLLTKCINKKNKDILYKYNKCI